MIYERWDTQFDIGKLVAHINEFVLPLEPTMQSPSFGGWSVLSSNGSYRDGWIQGHTIVKESMNSAELKDELTALGFKPKSSYVVPTEICHGYMAEVIDRIKSAGLEPRRARIISLTRRLASSWHRDGPENLPLMRIHVPIITNAGCLFETETERAHLPADGSSYLLAVNRLHRVINRGETNRFHLVADINTSRPF